MIRGIQFVSPGFAYGYAPITLCDSELKMISDDNDHLLSTTEIYYAQHVSPPPSRVKF